VLEITATDFDGGQATVQVPICVDACEDPGDGDGDPGDGDGDGEGDGDGDGDGDAGTDDGDEDPGATGGGFVPIGGEEATGCTCTARPQGSAFGGLGFLALLGLVLASRRASHPLP
jgi:hypothetical protein